MELPTPAGQPFAEVLNTAHNASGHLPGSYVAVMEVTADGLLLQEVAPGWTAENVQELTEPRLIVAPGLREMEL